MRTSKIKLENFSGGAVNFRAGGIIVDLKANSVGDNATFIDVTTDDLVTIRDILASKYPFVKLTVVEQSEPLRVFLNPVNGGETTGSFQKITLPENVTCKTIMIQVHGAASNDFVSFVGNPSGFHFSVTGDEAGHDFSVHIGSHVIDMERSENAEIGYVRAAENQYLVIEVVE